MAGVIRGRSPLILAVEDAPQLCCGVVHYPLLKMDVATGWTESTLAAKGDYLFLTAV